MELSILVVMDEWGTALCSTGVYTSRQTRSFLVVFRLELESARSRGSLSIMGRPRKTPEFPPPPPETLGERLRAERTRLGFTQVELAAALGVAERAVQNYEQDRNAIRMLVLERLGRLGFDINFLVFGNDNAQLDVLDQALWDRVVAWAEANCLDEHNQPLNEFARYQRITQVYRWLKNAGGGESEVEERLHRMSGARAA